jgi:sporulation protein YlmC with PRC-barrel domain
MIQASKKLLNLPVFTESGRELGRLVDFEIDTESQSIIDYFIQPHRAIANLFGNKLIVKRGQIVDILANKIIVVDNIAPSLKEQLEAIKKDTAVLPVTEKQSN